ncbi:hypothetical protein [Microvirga antarctica]|uniref:hypothetical protein n=1 Tax=Microvirga antarctica TaxID=2819233 RepID=UPI001B317C72|nr:hypothetical protein [Microvirga antarctica]
MRGLKVLGCAGALALMVAASGASAQEGEVMKSLLGSIGIIPKDKPPINYNERPPLVLPPKMELRAPAPPRSAESTANWPKDPDVAAARKASADARAPATSSDVYRANRGGLLSPEEMRAGRNPDNYVKTPPAMVGGQADNSKMSPDQLRSFKTGDDVKLSGNGIERRYLSDPPAPLLKAQGGAPLKASVDEVPVVDPDSPLGFIQQQNKR